MTALMVKVSDSLIINVSDLMAVSTFVYSKEKEETNGSGLPHHKSVLTFSTGQVWTTTTVDEIWIAILPWQCAAHPLSEVKSNG